MKKCIIGMSGGVDSSVSAYLLKQQGYQVIGVTMRLCGNQKEEESIEAAKKVCELLQIEHLIFDFQKEFKDIVIKDFVSKYKMGLTPNPCVVCNEYIKFGLFLDKALSLNADYIATGHYASIKDKMLIVGSEIDKDQTYFMHHINKDVLDKILFPLANFNSKEEVRKIAEEILLPVSRKKDSQEICFIDDNNYHSFIDNNSNPGNIIFKDNTILGKHNGIFNYTIGQRKGLNIAYKEPLYVIDIDTDKNTVIVGLNEDLMTDSFIVDNINLLSDKKYLNDEVIVKIRSRDRGVIANIKFIDDNKVLVTTKEKVRAVTPGQYAVFYHDNICLGGGMIIKNSNK